MSVVAEKKLTDKEKETLLKEILGADYSTAGNNVPILKGFIDKVGNVDSFFTLAEFLPIANKILAVRIFSVMATGASILSIIFIPISAMVDIINAYQTGRRLYSYRAIAYALTSWAFKKPVLNGSNRILLQAKTGLPRVDSKELIEYEKSWRKSSQDVVNKMNTIAINHNIPKDALQMFLRVISDNSEQKLCQIIMSGFEKQLSFIEASVWKSNYKVKYPS